MEEQILLPAPEPREPVEEQLQDATDIAPLPLDNQSENEEPELSIRPMPSRKPLPRGNLHATNWLADVSTSRDFDTVQVQFKNTRNGFYLNTSHLDLKAGDMVVVEASPGHDVGQVVMTGRLVAIQMRKAALKPDVELKKIYRKARKTDLDKFEEAKAREHDTMIRSRKIAESLELNMKIGDVEFQGDGTKAIFYYIADERVDFRKLIRLLADEFKIRIEMKQIGARQEAGRIGGIGPCGRPLCCATWMTHFVSVGTGAARFQDLSMNPQKLAGQCAKLKCCLNYEVDSYMEASRKMPHKDVTLETKDATYYFFKGDILGHKVTYSTDKSAPVNTVTIDAKRAFEIIALNKQGIKVDSIETVPPRKDGRPHDFIDLAEQDELTRFDKAKKKKKKKKKGPASDEQKNAAQPTDTQKPAEPKGNKKPEGKPSQKPEAKNGPKPNRPRDNRPGPKREPGKKPQKPNQQPKPQKDAQSN